MSSKSKLEKDYDDYNKAVERKAEQEIQKIREDIRRAKKEAEKTGERLEAIGKEEPKG